MFNILSDSVTAYVTMEVSAITDGKHQCTSQQFELNDCKASNLTKSHQQKEERPNHDPVVLWKEDPCSPYNENIINNQLRMARGQISDVM
jgi:hypothetical protein